MNIKDALDLFGADENTAFAAIQSKYRMLAMDYHPDRTYRIDTEEWTEDDDEKTEKELKREKEIKEETEKRDKYWTELTEAYGIIKDYAPDRDKIVWTSSENIHRVEDIFNMAITKDKIGNEEELKAVKEALEMYFSDGKKYIEKLKKLSVFEQVQLSDPAISIKKDYSISIPGLGICEYDGPRLSYYTSLSFFDETESIQSLIEPVRAKDRLHNKPYIPEYLSLFIEKFDLAKKISSKTIGNICRDIEMAEKEITSDRGFGMDGDACEHSERILEKNEILQHIDEESYEKSDLFNNPIHVFRDIVMGYRMRIVEKNNDKYTVGSFTWGGACDAEFTESYFVLSEDDYKLMELIMLGDSFMESNILKRLLA